MVSIFLFIKSRLLYLIGNAGLVLLITVFIVPANEFRRVKSVLVVLLGLSSFQNRKKIPVKGVSCELLSCK